ncbi:MAG: 6,7-dimethyl-8-ribityllumazine synthase [Planctomycetota bacterium]|jgi:6,7-dimethyl-8-ribityllumazine synthase
MGQFRAIQSRADARGARVAIIASRYHQEVIDAMTRGAVECFVACDGDEDSITIVPAPGAFELPLLASSCIATDSFDAIVVLGCIVKGETRHDEVIADAIAIEIARLGGEHRVPIGFGVLTVDNEAQARERAGGSKGNKGAEAMQAAIETLAAIRSLQPTGDPR